MTMIFLSKCLKLSIDLGNGTKSFEKIFDFEITAFELAARISHNVEQDTSHR